MGRGAGSMRCKVGCLVAWSRASPLCCWQAGGISSSAGKQRCPSCAAAQALHSLAASVRVPRKTWMW
jgi:hypothetical protein